MTALVNLSFELIGGTAATVTSSSSEPYALSHGDALILEVDGVTQSAQVDASNYANVAAATAAELSADLDPQLTDVSVTASSGKVIITHDVKGADRNIRVTGGNVQSALQFPTTLTAGTSTPGVADGWTLATSVTSEELAGFDAAIVEEPYEDFEEGWGDTLGSFTPSDLFLGQFDVAVPEGFEDFEEGWGSAIFGLGQTEDASFDSVPENFEDFEEDWGGPLVTIFSGTAGVFDTTPEDHEDFEEDWGGPLIPTFSGTLANFDQGGTPETVEDFEETATSSHIVTIVAAISGDVYEIEINGVQNTHVAQPADSPADIADELVAAINNNNANPVLALVPGVGGVSLLPKQAGIVEVVVRLRGTQPSSMQFNTTDLDPTALWIGNDRLTL